MNTVLQPMRYQITQTQLAAALTLAGLHPTSRSSLPDLKPSADPVPLLRNTMMLEDDGRLAPEASAMLAVAADPHRLLAVLTNQAGRSILSEAVFVGDAKGERFVSQGATPEGDFDLAFLPSMTQAALLVDDLLGLTSMVAVADSQSVELDFAGYAALLGAADTLQVKRLEAFAARQPRPEIILTPRDITTQAEKGLSLDDTRWAVTAGRRVCPIDLSKAFGQSEQGLDQLATRGIVTNVKGGYAFTARGYALAYALGQLIITGGLTLSAASEDDQVRVSHVTVFRSAAAIHVVRWLMGNKAQPRVLVDSVDATGALYLVNELLGGLPLPPPLPKGPFRKDIPPQPPGREPENARADAQPEKQAGTSGESPENCLYCGAELDPGQRFCEECGKSVGPAASMPASCRNCNRHLDHGVRFCEYCGEKIQ